MLSGRLSKEQILRKECDPDADVKALSGVVVPANDS